MDGLLATILAGIIVAGVAAILGFYFNRAQEQRKRQEQSQEELDERRAQVFAEITRQARSIVRDSKTHEDYLESLIETLERTAGHYKYNFYTALEPEIEVLKVMKPLLQHSSALRNKIASLRDYFRRERSVLDSTSQNAFHSFIEALEAVGKGFEAGIGPEKTRALDQASQPEDLLIQEIQDEIDRLSAITSSRKQVAPYNIQKMMIARREKRTFNERWQGQYIEEYMNDLPLYKQLLETLRSRTSNLV
jgi:hypothetical protein